MPGDLTWNQERALQNLAKYAGAVTPRQISEPFAYFNQYLCVSAARAALGGLARKGFAEAVNSTVGPRRYRITDAGRRALAEAARDE